MLSSLIPPATVNLNIIEMEYAVRGPIPMRAAELEKQGMKGVECFEETGAMYLFLRLNKLPTEKMDFDYCMALLEQTGSCTVNGAGFRQKEGISHLRIAFLPPRELLAQVLPEWIKFHNNYVG